MSETMTATRTYSELRRISNFEERFEYLALRGVVGDSTFGFDRYMNQKFYRSAQWRHIRDQVIVRDMGCDLGVDGFQIHAKLYIHHLNPMTAEDLKEGEESVLDPEYLISTTLRTHNAIHYGDSSLLSKPFVARRRGDTKLW
jgi:hypothetical protein